MVGVRRTPCPRLGFSGILASGAHGSWRLQLLEIKAAGGGPAEGGEAPLKPLTQVLAEAKEAKEAAFQEQWKQMKTGALPEGPSLGRVLHALSVRSLRLPVTAVIAPFVELSANI